MASTIGGPLSDRVYTRDGQITGASGPLGDGRGGTMHSAVDDLSGADGLGPSPVPALIEDGDDISPSAAGNPTTAPRSPLPARPDMTKERDDKSLSSSVGHSGPTSGVPCQAISDHTEGNDSDTVSSALDDPKYRMEGSFENRNPSEQVNNIPRVFYGPNKITESSMYQNTYIELDAATPTSFVRIPTVQGQDLDSVSEREGFKTLSAKIQIVSEVPNTQQEAKPFTTDSAPTSETEVAARLSTSNSGLNGSVSRSSSTRSASGDIDSHVSGNFEKASQPLPTPDRSAETMLQMSETSSAEAIRRENLPSTSPDLLATRAGPEVAKLSDQLNKKMTDDSNVTPPSGLGLTTLEDPNTRDEPLQLNTGVSTTIASSIPSSPQLLPFLPPCPHGTNVPSSSGLELTTLEDRNMRDKSLQLNTSASTTIESSSPSPPQRLPPLRPRPPLPSTISQLSSPASQVTITPMSSTTGTDLYTFSESSQDSCISGSSSCPSSSDLPEVNTADNIQYYTDNCAAASSGKAPPLTLREQGQIQLRNLRTQLAAAKARGDPKSQEDAIQKSIDVIWRTQLSPPAEPATTQITKEKAPSPKPKKKASMMRFPLLTSSTKSEALGQAAADGDEPTLTRLLSENVHVNCTSLGSKTPMMRAAVNGRVRCMSILKASGADEFAVDKSGATALHHAILSNQIQAVKWLLETYPPSEVVRHRSSMRSRMDAANWVRSQRNLREIADTTGLRPLHLAVEHDTGGMVETLLGAGADMEAKNKQGRTPLIHAIITSRRDSFDILLRSGARIDHTDAMGMSALHWAAGLGQVATITTLLDKGASRLAHDLAGHEPIHQAASGGHVLAVEALLTEGSDLDRPTKSGDNGNGESLLHIASLYNHLDLARYLLKNGVQVNYWSDRPSMWSYHPRAKLLGSSLTPLHYACCLGHFEMAALLLDHNALVNAATVDGYTPLMMAVEAENTDLVNLLHSRGAKVNASLPGTLSTALHMAARRGDIETVRELCRAGADFRARAGKDSYKRTPLETCGECHDKKKRCEVLEYLNIVLHNDSVKRGLPPTQLAYFGQLRQQAPLVQQARNSAYSQEPAPPPPYSKAPPVWR